MKSKAIAIIWIFLMISTNAFSQNCQTCGPLGDKDVALSEADAATTKLQENLDATFMQSLQDLMLKNLKGDKAVKYLTRGAPEYVSDDFLEYSTNIFAGEAAKRVQKEYESKNGKGSVIPAEKLNDLVYKKAKELEQGTIQEIKDECFEYDCLEPGCGERKRNAELIMTKIKELEAARDSSLLQDIRALNAEIFKHKYDKGSSIQKVNEEKMTKLQDQLEALLGTRSLLTDKSNFSAAIGDLKEYLVNKSPATPRSHGLKLEPMLSPPIGIYSTYYNKDILQYANPKDYFKLDFKVEESEKIKFKQGYQDKQFNVQSVELDQNEIKMHQDNNFSLNGTDFSKKVSIPDANKLNAIYCESSASDLRPTRDAKGKTIKKGEFDYLNFDLSLNRNEECKQKVIDHFNLTQDKIVTVKADGLSEKEILDKQAAFYANKDNLGKVQIFQKFKGSNGDGTSGYKSFYCASPAYVRASPYLCPGEAIKAGHVIKEDLKNDWNKKYGYSNETFEKITNKTFPPSFQAFLNQKLKNDPNYQFDPSDLTPEQLSELDAIYDSSRYVKMKVYHSPELVEPEAEITYHQKICSDSLAIRFSPELKPTGNNTFIYVGNKSRGDGLYGSKKDWGGVGCSF